MKKSVMNISLCLLIVAVFVQCDKPKRPMKYEVLSRHNYSKVKNSDYFTNTFKAEGEFKGILTKIYQVQLPCEILEIGKRYNKVSPVDIAFFRNEIIRMHTFNVNPQIESSFGHLDKDVIARIKDSLIVDINEKRVQILPNAILWKAEQFVVLSITIGFGYTSTNYIISFNSSGRIINGILSTYGAGNQYANAYRQSMINKDSSITLTENSKFDDSDDDNYTFISRLKIKSDGSFKVISSKIVYGKDYQNVKN